MKKIVFSFLGLLMLGLSSCIKTGDNITTYPYLPAIVGFTSMFQPTIITQYGTFYTPELQDQVFGDLWEGDAIGITFTVNHDQPLVSEYPTAYDVNCFKINKRRPEATVGGGSTSTEFDVPIEGMGINASIKNVFFFSFRHTAPTDQEFIYEMTYDQDDTEVFTLNIRAKKNNTGTKTKSTFDYYYAFDMYYFCMAHKNPSDNKITFKIQYKTGVDDEGNDKYELYKDSYGYSIFTLTVE